MQNITPQNTLQRLVSIATAAKETGLSAFELRKGIHCGRFPFVRAGRCLRVRVDQIWETLEAEALENQQAAKSETPADWNL